MNNSHPESNSHDSAEQVSASIAKQGASESQPSSASQPSSGASLRVLTLFDCVCIIVGTIIGSGIFKAPSMVAATVPDFGSMILVWVVGGSIALIGALCFAELTTTYPDRGGDYGYLKRAFHPTFGFAFSWTAFWIIRPANIGAMAIIFGEFAGQALPGSLSFFAFAVLAVVGVSATNLLGVAVGKTTQNILTVAKVLGILLVVVAAFLFWPGDAVNADLVGGVEAVQQAELQGDINLTAQNDAAVPEANQLSGESELVAEGSDAEITGDPQAAQPGWFWLAMVFVMFTFGGWNDIAFVASEVREPKKNLLRSLIVGTLVVLGVYLLVNFALLVGLGFERMAEVGFGGNVTSELVTQNMGDFGGRLLSLLVCVSCLGSINAMIFTSPRIYSATAADYPALGWLAGEKKGEGWWRAMILQTVVTLGLVVAFGQTDKAFENLTVANAPFFWSFLGLTVVAMMYLRVKSKGEFTGYKSPLFPVLPILFLLACGFMVYRSWIYMVEKELEIWTYLMLAIVVAGVVLSIVLKREGPDTRS